MPNFPKSLSTLIVGSGRLRPAKPLKLPAGIVLSGKQRPMSRVGFEQPNPAVFYPSPQQMPPSGEQSSNNNGSGNGEDDGNTTPIFIVWQPSYSPNHPQRFQAVPRWQFEYLFQHDRRQAFLRDALMRNAFRTEKLRYMQQQYEAHVAAHAAAADDGLSVDVLQQVVTPNTTTRGWSVHLPTVWRKLEKAKQVISTPAGMQPPTPPPGGDDDKKDKDKTAAAAATAGIDTTKDNNKYTKGAWDVPLPNMKLNLPGHPATFGCGSSALHNPSLDRIPGGRTTTTTYNAEDRVAYKGWIDRYLANLRLRISDHPATFGVEHGDVDHPKDHRDLSDPQVRVWKYDWELERAITVRTRAQAERAERKAQGLEMVNAAREVRLAREAREAKRAQEARGLEMVRRAREARLARERLEARRKQEARVVGEDEKKYLELLRK
ncbi:hypothetical protein PG995_011633 [Apiospora arundinis]